MSVATFTHEVFLNHSAKDKVVVRSSFLSASIGEWAGVRLLRKFFPRLEPLNPALVVGRVTPCAPGLYCSGGAHGVTRPTGRFVGSLDLQQVNAHWGHEPSWKSHRFKAFMDERKAILGRFESLGAIPRFMERASVHSN